MKQYNAHAEINSRDPAIASDLIDALISYSPAISASARGWIEIVITFPAADLQQAISTAYPLLSTAAGRRRLLSLEVLTTEEFDARLGVQTMPALVTVAEAAEILGVSVSAVSKRIRNGSLPGTRVGAVWVIQRAAIEALAQQQSAS